MDDADRAQIEQERTIERAMAARASARGTTRRVTECVECGAPIESVRVEHGFTTCIECARFLELQNLRGG